MENEKARNKLQNSIAQLAARMVDLFMPCNGTGMIRGYAAILVLEKAIREDMPPEATEVAKELAGSIKAEMEDR